MSNTITINFIECSPAPLNGYKVFWRILGSGDPYTDAGNVTNTPAIISDEINPAGTCYEGYIQSDCTQSGESVPVLGEQIPWATDCEQSGVTNYTIELTAPCTGIDSNYLVSGGTAGDIVTVRATFIGMIQKNSNNFTRANLSIFAGGGTFDDSESSCYVDALPHPFSITADTVITMTGPTAIVTLSAVVHNSSASTSSVSVAIIDVNGEPVNVPVGGCKGTSSTGGTC